MNRAFVLSVKALIVFLGIAALAFLILEPNLEGRNANSTLFQVYFNDPFLVYAYVASIPFFVALAQAFRLIGYAERQNVFSRESVRALRNIRTCAIAIILFAVGAEAWLFAYQRTVEEDIAGGVSMGLFVICTSLVIATEAAVFETVLRSAVDMKSEHDLTV
jgi:hypothetical protein